MAWKNATDLTLHWADPLNQGPQMTNYAGPIPAVVHLHGGEVPPVLDGGPDAWVTSDGISGHGYYTFGQLQGQAAPGPFHRYIYPNTQEAANIWFHDHVLGITRLNVYAGLAGAYALIDPLHPLPAGLTPVGIQTNATTIEPIIPLVIQDRQFDTNGELFFDNVGINPEHPYWVPEFVGDVIVVNGKAWPVLNVEKKRYRFLFLNGSNARAYELDLFDKVNGVPGPRMWVIGTDGGYLDSPVMIDPAAKQKLIIMPGERYDVIIDFADPNWVTPSGTLRMRNTARTPYPGGMVAQGRTTARVLEIVVGAPPAGGDQSYDPAMGGVLNSIQRLPGTPQGPAIDTTPGTGNVQLVRQLTLNEFMGPGGPLEVLVNNTKWGGHTIPELNGGIRPDFVPDPSGLEPNTYYSELPNEGETEIWEIINLTADAHPIHLHLVQFQLVDRQPFNFATYNALYDSLFPATSVTLDPMTGVPYPGGVFIGGYGPPNDYFTPNADGAVGGNPAITAHLLGLPMPPLPQEEGWKDTVIMYPGEVTRIMVRWAPTDLPVNTAPANANFDFDPDSGHGYVWHCHIIDHEDNEMMRPTSVIANPVARTIVQGVDY
jgi:FtsP/CotA-like multicopper oxidase with cupredoxin domain